PVAFDFGSSNLDFDASHLNPPKNRAPLYIIGGMAVLAIVIAAVSSSDSKPATSPATNAAQQPQASPTLNQGATTPASTAAPATTTLTEEQKKALAEADKKIDAKRRSKAPLPGPAARGPRAKEADPFNRG